MNEFNQPSRRTSGFTLIELLTVIAIIGILAAILIPVVGAVRESARKIKCMSNMRQVAVAILTYESENNVLPGPIYRRVRRPLVTEVEDLRELNWIIDSYIGGKRSEIWDCPTNAIVYDAAQNEGSVTFLLNGRRNYPNPPRLFGYPGASAENDGLPKSLEQIVSAGTDPISSSLTELSQIWMISDVDGQNYNKGSIGSAAGPHSVPLSDDAPPAHESGRNYVFFDGHAEYIDKENFPR